MKPEELMIAMLRGGRPMVVEWTINEKKHSRTVMLPYGERWTLYLPRGVCSYTVAPGGPRPYYHGGISMWVPERPDGVCIMDGSELFIKESKSKHSILKRGFK